MFNIIEHLVYITPGTTFRASKMFPIPPDQSVLRIQKDVI